MSFAAFVVWRVWDFSWEGEQTSFCSLIPDRTEWAGVGGPTKQVRKPVVTAPRCAAPILPGM